MIYPGFSLNRLYFTYMVFIGYDKEQHVYFSGYGDEAK